MSGIGFDDLLQQAEHLTTGLDGGFELPRVQRNFQQLLDAGQRLCSKTTTVQDNAQIKASLLLSAQGKDVPTVSDRLKSLTASSQTFEPLETVSDTDIEGFLRNERENAILAVVEEQKQKTFEDVEKKHWQARLSEWESEKQQILNKLIGTDGTLNFTQEISAQLSTSYYSNNVTNVVNPRSSMDPWELAYAKQVHIFNDRIIDGGLPLNLADLCRNAAEKLKDVSLTSLWSMVKYMTEAPSGAGQFSSVLSRRTSKSLLKGFISQARKYLEDSYIDYMQNCVYARPHIAQRGGIPGTLNLVKSFLKVQPTNAMQSYDDGDVDGAPLWAVIFYCLRCGAVDAAVEVADLYDHVIPEFSLWIQEYASDGARTLSSSSESRMRIQFKRSVRASTDPYKVAVYCIIGRCDVTEVHSEVAQKAEDYLWIKLCQVVIEDKTIAHSDVLTLSRLQTLLADDYGESHFNASSNPLLYFQMLLLTCQFESALEFLSRFEPLRCHAAHIALALYTQGLLLTPASLHAKMLTTESIDESPLTVVRRLNLPRLVMMYTRKFELTDAREALNYYYLLRDIRIDGQSLLSHCTSELVRETGEFEMLLGKLNPDGSRKPGAIDKYCGADVQQLIAKVASDTEAKGLHEDAVFLYDLCGNHDQTLALLNRLLCTVISSSDTSHPDRSRLKALSLAIAERYRSQAIETSRSLRSTFHLLLDLLSFFDLYHADRTEQALDVVRELQILPVNTSQVQSKIAGFKLYSDEIRQNISNILLATMNLLSRQCKQQENLNKSVSTKSGNAVCANARQHARALISFAGMLPYHLPGDTTARLVQLEVQMN